MTIDTADLLLVELRRRATLAAERDDRGGYFAALYALMTERVCEGVQSGRFTDGDRLQRLTCHFAARYLDALDRYEAGGPTPASWTVAFEAARRWRPIILQHVLLGMNAHINYDLGISAAQVSDGGRLHDVQGDFDEINAVLAELLEDVQERLGAVSPWMRILDFVGGRKDEVVVNFSMRHARDAAWDVATRYAPLDAEARAAAEADLDRRVARFAGVVRKPGRLISCAAVPVRLRERASVAEVIAALGVPPA
ncbi:MAG: DUF5995 family protein [Dehalococcoidia bacterium]